MSKKASGEAPIDNVNDAAMPRLCERYFKDLAAYAATILKSGIDAEDVAQHAIIALSTRGRRLNGEDAIRAFLFKTAKNKCHNIWRKKKNELAYQAFIDEQAYSLPDAEAKIYKTQLAVMLKQQVDKLPPRDKELLQLVFKGYPSDEISTMLKIERGTFDTRKSRAVARLKALLARANIHISVEDLLSIILCISCWIFYSFFGLIFRFF